MPYFDIIYYFAVCGHHVLRAPVLCGTIFLRAQCFVILLFCDSFNDVCGSGMVIWDDFKKSLWVLVPEGHIA